jgi:hypothetical protein
VQIQKLEWLGKKLKRSTEDTDKSSSENGASYYRLKLAERNSEVSCAVLYKALKAGGTNIFFFVERVALISMQQESSGFFS